MKDRIQKVENDEFPEFEFKVVTPAAIGARTVLDEKIQFYLSQIAERTHLALGVKNNAEIDDFILARNNKLRGFFYDAELGNDQQVKGIIRFYNFCLQIGCSDILDFSDSYYKNTPNYVVKDLRNLIRLTICELSKKMFDLQILLEMHISAIQGGGNENNKLASEISDIICSKTIGSKGGNTSEIMAVLILLRDCYKITA